MLKSCACAYRVCLIGNFFGKKNHFFHRKKSVFVYLDNFLKII